MIKAINMTMKRRTALQLGTAAAAGTFGILKSASANQHPSPRPTSLTYLDRSSYVHNMKVHGHWFEDKEFSQATSQPQMMSKGENRYLFQSGTVLDVTEPLNPKIIAEDLYSGHAQLSFNKDLGRWILINSTGVGPTSTHAKALNGKYDDPSLVDAVINRKGLRGVRIYDATEPTNLQLLSEWSCDQGDPKRPLQTGSGAGQNWYDGGKYAYLDTAPDNTFTNMESPIRHYTNGVQVLDVSDPSKPKFVSNWWVPGQTTREMDEYRKWREFGDRNSFTCKNGPFYVPKRVEEGGKYAYSTWGSFGFLIHDVSNPAAPKLIGQFRPDHAPGGIQFYWTDIGRLDLGYVITGPEILNPDCGQPWYDVYTVDVRDVTNPKPIATLPIPEAPPEAPYKDFCDRRGRFGARDGEGQKAPGTPNHDFTCVAYFNGGAQCFNVHDPAKPRRTAYFVPPHGGDLGTWNSHNRPLQTVFVEWDRKIIWVAGDTGWYLLTTPELGEPVLGPMPVERWSLEGLNEGAP